MLRLRIWSAFILIFLAATAVFAAAVFVGEPLGVWRYVLFASSVTAMVGGFLAWRKVHPSELELQRVRQARESEKAQFTAQKIELDDFRRQAKSEIDQLALRVQQREEDLSHRLLAFYETGEYPQPIDLGTEPSDREITELAARDREVMTLLEAESRRLLEDIRTNKYSPDGVVDNNLIREDFYSLILRVAKIYNPQAENPLLETSIEQVLRSVSRVSLHLLVAMDRLPVNIKEYNVRRLYSTVRQATKAYDVYRAASPYIPYMNTAYYLGRFALGANPFTLAAWKVLGEIGSRGAKALATKLVNRQALVLIHDMVRIVGFEVAGVYGGDFRHRDANWVYGAELTDLMRRFPVSRESLSAALKELGALQLRSEYDRAYLYRCIAAQTAASFGSSRPAAWLGAPERQAIAQRLEKFFHAYIHGGKGERSQNWKADVERRLEIKLTLAPRPTGPSGTHQATDAVRSLASYLVAIKEREGQELPELLAACHLLGRLGDEDRRRLLETLRDSPPFFFEQPDLDPQDELTTAYLSDLMRLAAGVPPHTDPSYAAALDAAAYFRHELKGWQNELLERSLEQINDRLPASAPPQRMPLEAARAALALGGAEERWRFLLGGVTLHWAPGRQPLAPVEGRLWLLGLSDRLVLFSSEPEGEALWRAGRDVRLQRESGVLIDGCILRGGEWLRDEHTPAPELRLSGVMKSRFSSHFGPLWDFCRGEQAVS